MSITPEKHPSEDRRISNSQMLSGAETGVHNPPPPRGSLDSRTGELGTRSSCPFPLSGLEGRFEAALQETAKPRSRLELWYGIQLLESRREGI